MLLQCRRFNNRLAGGRPEARLMVERLACELLQWGGQQWLDTVILLGKLGESRQGRALGLPRIPPPV